MKRFLTLVVFVFLTCGSFAQQTGQLMRGKSPSGATPFISVDETGKLNTTSTISSVPISITTQFVATDSLNQYKVNIASVSVSSVPVKITNWNDMPFNPAPPYATNTSQMLRVAIATAEVLLASPIAMDDDDRTIVNIGSYSTVIPASITNFPATTQLVTNDDNELLVAISSQSAPLVASISNLPETQQLKVDTDSNLTVNLASFTASMSVGITNLPSDQTVTLSNSLGSTSNPITATITGTPEVTNPGISTATLYTGTLATDAVTLISSIVSLTANDIVEVQVRATAYRGPSDVASATLQEFGTKMAADDTFTFRYNGADFGLIADSAATAKYGLTVYKDR